MVVRTSNSHRSKCLYLQAWNSLLSPFCMILARYHFVLDRSTCSVAFLYLGKVCKWVVEWVATKYTGLPCIQVQLLFHFNRGKNVGNTRAIASILCLINLNHGFALHFGFRLADWLTDWLTDRQTPLWTGKQKKVSFLCVAADIWANKPVQIEHSIAATSSWWMFARHLSPSIHPSVFIQGKAIKSLSHPLDSFCVLGKSTSVMDAASSSSREC